MPKVLHLYRASDKDRRAGAFVGRPSKFGNPYRIGKDGTREQVIAKFKVYFLKRLAWDEEFKDAVLELRGKNLLCFCAPAACHAQVILDYLNSPVV